HRARDGCRGTPLRGPRGGARGARRRRARAGRAVIALLMAGGIALASALVITRCLSEWLRAHEVGQSIREEGPQGHLTKAGTPIMGGIAIVAAAAVGYGVAH